nr:MAG TPA: hypothetical protein [Crassvirales sp.]
MLTFKLARCYPRKMRDSTDFARFLYCISAIGAYGILVKLHLVHRITSLKSSISKNPKGINLI